MGGGAQLINWPDGFVDALVARGLQPIRFDNRDAGHSTHFHHAPKPDLPAALAGVNVPELVFAALTGRPAPPVRPVRVGTTWCELRRDFQARKAEQIGLDWWKYDQHLAPGSIARAETERLRVQVEAMERRIAQLSRSRGVAPGRGPVVARRRRVVR